MDENINVVFILQDVFELFFSVVEEMPLRA